jgi:hypothetical protein
LSERPASEPLVERKKPLTTLSQSERSEAFYQLSTVFLEALFFRHRRAFARTFPFVLGTPHLHRNAECAVIAPMSLITWQSFSIAAIITDKNFGLGLLLYPSHVGLSEIDMWRVRWIPKIPSRIFVHL